MDCLASYRSHVPLYFGHLYLLTTLSGKKQKTYINKNAGQVEKSFFRSLLHSWNITIEFYVIFVPFQAGNKKKRWEQFVVELKNK